MTIIGREEEQESLRRFMDSGRSEFIVVYGRRRVGKTFLISEFFNDQFSFHATGLSDGVLADQLAMFDTKLSDYGLEFESPSQSWLQAFERLKDLLKKTTVLRDADTGRRVVFIDEMPWFDTPRSGFKTALEFFWNDWGSRQKDLALIVCGSATSWVARNLLESKGGLHNRVTRIIDLQPFTLKECGQYFSSNGFCYTSQQAIECIMAFGGVPFYLDLLDASKSLAQNIDALCFRNSGQLRHEFERLYATLFKNPEHHVDVVKALAKRTGGMARAELRRLRGLQGTQLTKVLSDLELCGFVRSYRDFTKKSRGMLFQLVDPFTLFYLKCIESGRIDSWMHYVGTPSYNAWAGLAFEIFCLNNVDLIKDKLGVRSVQTQVTAWRSSEHSPGAQIDLLIDRRDGVINVCEIKFSLMPFSINASYRRNLENKLAAFKIEASPKKALFLTMVTANGMMHNQHYQAIVQNEVMLGDVLDGLV